MKQGNKKKASKTSMASSATTPIIIAAVVVLLAALVFAFNVANVQGTLNAFAHPRTNATLYYCGIAVSEQQYALLNSTGQYQFEGNPCHQYYINGTIGAFNTVLSGGIDGPITLYKNTLLVPMEPPAYNYTPPSYYPPNMSMMWGGLARSKRNHRKAHLAGQFHQPGHDTTLGGKRYRLRGHGRRLYVGRLGTKWHVCNKHNRWADSVGNKNYKPKHAHIRLLQRLHNKNVHPLERLQSLEQIHCEFHHPCPTSI